MARFLIPGLLQKIIVKHCTSTALGANFHKPIDSLKINDRFLVVKDTEERLLITVTLEGYLKCIKD